MHDISPFSSLEKFGGGHAKMLTYIVLMKGTQKGKANPKTLAADIQAAEDTVKRFGGKQLDWNLTMGPYDAVAKVQFPDEQSAAAFLLAVAATGNQETLTMRAFGLEEVKKIVQSF
ncbi:MAG: GYD domain-containing protein [Candidatus Bathyarchaeia archaeon]|jgi:uncharacterized protein with GYD domain